MALYHIFFGLFARIRQLLHFFPTANYKLLKTLASILFISSFLVLGCYRTDLISRHPLWRLSNT